MAPRTRPISTNTSKNTSKSAKSNEDHGAAGSSSSSTSALKYAVICASNMNRSMEAHHILSKKGLNIVSFGTGTSVKLPGPSADRPNVYPFGTPYDHIYRDLDKRDHDLYTQNGVLTMLDRNRNIKKAPQKFQECINNRSTMGVGGVDFYSQFDVIITCEERCFDAVLEELMQRSDPSSASSHATHVVNFEIKDTPDGAATGARLISQFTQLLEERPDEWRDCFDEILEGFQESKKELILHAVAYI